MRKFVDLNKLTLTIGLFIFTLSVNAADRDLYVVDIGPNRMAPWQVLKFDENGENPEVFIDSQLNSPQEILFLEQVNQALVSNFGSNKISRFNATTGEYIDDFATGIGGPTRITFGSDGLLYVLQWFGNGRVLRYDSQGNFVDEFTQVGVTNSIGLDWDSQGNLYVSSFDAAHVRKFDQNGNDLGLFINSNLAGPTNIWFGDDGNLRVVDWTSGRIKVFDSNGNFLSDLVIGLSEPEGIEFFENGNFLIGNGGNGSVKEYEADGTFVRDLVSSGSGGLAKPNGLRLRPGIFQINSGLNDAWFNPATAGQGFFINVFPNIGKMFLAWFTYDTERPPAEVQAILGGPGQRWMTAFGDISGNKAELDIEMTKGGIFDAADPTPTQSPDGTIVVEFYSCKDGKITYDIPSIDQQGVVPIERIALDNVAFCESLANPVVKE